MTWAVPTTVTPSASGGLAGADGVAATGGAIALVSSAPEADDVAGVELGLTTSGACRLATPPSPQPMIRAASAPVAASAASRLERCMALKLVSVVPLLPIPGNH